MVVCFEGSPKRMEKEEMGEYLPPDPPPPSAEKCNLHTQKTGYVTLFVGRGGRFFFGGER